MDDKNLLCLSPVYNKHACQIIISLIYCCKLCNCTQTEHCNFKWVSSHHWVWKWVHVCIPWDVPYRHKLTVTMKFNFWQCTVVKARCKDIMICWGLDVTSTFILCMGNIGQKYIVHRVKSWNGGNGCWFVHCCICHQTNLPQNWILTIPRANSFYVEVGSKAGIPSPSWNFWSWVFLPYHCFCCCCIWTRSTLSDQLRLFSTLVSRYVWWTALTNPGTGFSALLQDTQSSHAATQMVKAYRLEIRSFW